MSPARTWFAIKMVNFMCFEDNMRCPSGVSYVLENRQVLKRTFPPGIFRLSGSPGGRLSE
ncbi:MAG: circularly permuted type 2 ATP-grasp protein [Desulfobacterales bacterium]